MNTNTALLFRSPLKREDFRTGLLCLLPSAVIVFIFIIFPIFFSLFLSVHEWSILTSEMDFIGLGNFDRMIHSKEFWNTLKNTFVYTMGVVPVGAAASLGLALLLNRKVLASGFFRTAYFLPVITSTIAVAIVWFWIFDTNNGLLNIIIRKFGGTGIPWLSSSKYAMLSIIIVTIWKNAGYHMIILLAGLKAIPDEYYEAAQIDGASAVQKFFSITLPMISPALVFVLITNTIFSFQAFGQIYTMTGGGPSQSTSVIVYYLYQRAFEFQEMGYASAVAWVIFVILLLLTLLQLRLQRKDL
ncbi:MAG TPA: sugar ABC transporter permease [Spirochaeta sp.]|nr:sugar ABC transporter permease [Spirochaeta sp.]